MDLKPTESDEDNESNVFLSSLDSNPWMRRSVSEKKIDKKEKAKQFSDQKLNTFTKKPLSYSKSVVANFISWLGLNEEAEQSQEQLWQELVRRRRLNNRLVGQYKPTEDGDESAVSYPQTPHIIDPLFRPGLQSQVSTSSISRRALRKTNSMKLRSRESVWKMAYNGIKTAFTPQIPIDNLHPLHPRSVTLHQIRLECSRDVTNEYLDDVFFDVPTPTATFPKLIMPSFHKNPSNPTISHTNLPPLMEMSPVGEEGVVSFGSERLSLIERRKVKFLSAESNNGENINEGNGGERKSEEKSGGEKKNGGIDKSEVKESGANKATGEDTMVKNIFFDFEDINVRKKDENGYDTDDDVFVDTPDNVFIDEKLPDNTLSDTKTNIYDAKLVKKLLVNTPDRSVKMDKKPADIPFYEEYDNKNSPLSKLRARQITATKSANIFQPMRKMSTEVIEELLNQQDMQNKKYHWTYPVIMKDTPTGSIKKTGRQIGRGFAQYLADLDYRKSRIDNSVRKKINSLPDYRPYFTYWCTCVQILIYAIAISVHDFAPFGLSYSTISEEVLKPNLAMEESFYMEENNMWIGLRQADLIHLGARYSGCMRRDELVQKELLKIKRYENKTGCCIRTDGSGCYQTSEDECLYTHGRHLPKSIFSVWKTWRGGKGPHGRSAGAVCQQDPRFCMRPVLPPGKDQHDWPDDITQWPVCDEPYKARDLPSDEDLDHLTCGITGRPCCVGVRGRCLITTREDCAFMKGYYHDEMALCSQVDCMQDICGMIPFITDKHPNQIYRLISSLFIHAGVIHLLVTVVFQLTVMRDLEKLAGWLRIAIIYILSGMGGSLLAAILLPHLIEAGPSGSQFGLLSCLFVEVIQNWYILKRPKLALLRLCLILFFLFCLGLMPIVDNIAHIGGFVIGFMLSFVFLPYISFTLMERKRKLITVIVCAFLSCFFLIGLLVMFYLPPFFECSFCSYFNCIPITPTICSNIAIVGSNDN